MPHFNLADVFTPAGLAAFGQVILIDLMLAGDNVVILGTLTSGLPERARRRVLAIGVGAALICLVGFSLIATRLLDVVGLLFAGGLLLLWVGWKLWREIRSTGRVHTSAPQATVRPTKSVGRAALQIALADLSMSLDNVLAVAGAARDHPTVLFAGLALSVTATAVAANYIARIVARYSWIAYLGLAAILWVAGSMVFEGWSDPHVGLRSLL